MRPAHDPSLVPVRLLRRWTVCCVRRVRIDGADMTREDWQRFEKIQWLPDVQTAMRARCEEQGHEIEYGITAMFQMTRTCKWCGARQ